MSDVDFDYLHGHDDYAARAEALLARGTSLVIVTRGPKGALGWHAQAGPIEVAVPTVEVVDTIGAGDTFQAAMLFALRKLGRIGRESLRGLSHDEMRKALTFAGACAAVTCTREGADPPRWDDMAATWERLG